jgi:hydroxyacylglutathione hydrolase
MSPLALVAQLDRVPGYEPGGCRFEPFPVRIFGHLPQGKCPFLFHDDLHPFFHLNKLVFSAQPLKSRFPKFHYCDILLHMILKVLAMLIFAFPSGPFDTNAYVVACPTTKEAAIVDPAPGSASSIEKCIAQNGLKPAKIILTHSHWDHIADVSPVKNRYNIPVLIHAEDAPNLKQPGSDQLPCPFSFPGVTPDQTFKEGDLIKVGNSTLTVIETPGHTPGGVCFYSAEEKTLFSGDTLFKGSIGNLSFPTSRPDKMWPSLDKLALLPPNTNVYPGHGPSTTIGAESSWLPRAREYFE